MPTVATSCKVLCTYVLVLELCAGACAGGAESVRCMSCTGSVEVVLEAVLKVLEIVLYMMEVVNGVRCVLWVLGVMLCMLFCVLFCVLFCMLLCILEAAEGELCLLEVLEVMRSVLLCILEAVEG